MTNIEKLQALVNRFQVSLPYYKDTKNNYNEHSCRIEYIDPLLKILGWDVANEKGLVPQYREVIAENYSTPTDRPDYTMTLRGVAKFFVEAKKPAVDITRTNDPAFQTRKYGWNANHRIAVLTNFEHLAIYDTCYIPKESDGCTVARYRIFHFTEYIDRFDEILAIISRDAVYSGEFDKYLDDKFPTVGGEKQPVDTLFLAQINEWRVLLSNELYKKGDRYQSLEVLNDVVQEFINQIVFLRICEDKNLPLYHRLQDTISEPAQLQARLEELFRAADHRYNSGMFSGEDIIFDLSSAVISDMIKGLYYPQSPYLFNIIEPNLLGKIYEMFLTEQLELLSNNTIGLGKKRDCLNRSVVTTPTEIVKYMVEKTLSKACSGKSPTDILNLRIADIACGSGIFLEEVFAYLQDYCIQQYIASGEQEHLLEIGNGCYKLTLEEKKRILCSCIYGIDIDIHAVEVAKFSLLIKLIENETDPSVADVLPILPNLSSNILFGNSLVSMEELSGMAVSAEELIELAPFDWNTINGGNQFSVIIGNPPYVNTEDMHTLLPETEVKVYKKKYKTSHKQFDKYFIFIEQAVRKTTEDGYICYIVPNKFFKIGAGEKLRNLIAKNQMLVSLDDFGDAQLFEDKIIYSSILLLCKHRQDTFMYSNIDSANKLWAGEEVSAIELNTSTLNKLPWRLTTDMDFLLMLQKLDRIAVPLTKHAEIFNGIQTSAERPTPIYWFSSYDIVAEFQDAVEICRDGNNYSIEKALLRPYFKPTRQGERGLNSYSILHTDKRIIFPYDEEGHLIPIEKMRTSYPGTYAYLEAYYDRLVPKCVSKSGVRDVPNATEDTWYQYGRTQALTAFINTPKLIVGVLSKEPMYVLDTDDTLIASGGTAGYCAISKKADSPYALEYIQAWLSNPITERILEIVGSDFEGGFTARGTFVLSTLPFVELNFEDNGQKALYDRVIEASREIYDINSTLSARPAKRISVLLQSRKDALIKEIQGLIERVYQLDFLNGVITMKLKKDSSEQKLRGAYYTPLQLANAIVHLFTTENIQTVLEPSCGDGVFLDSLEQASLIENITSIDAVEIEPDEALKVQNNYRNYNNITIYNEDFFEFYNQVLGQKRYDLILGNPPYIRYQYLTEHQRELQSKILVSHGMKSNKLINAWVAFLVACVQLLSETGKIAFVIPAEIMQVAYAEDLRLFLSEHFAKITLITFEQLVFPDIEQEVLVFIGEKGVEERGIRIIEMNNLYGFSTLDLQQNSFQKMQHAKEKWTKYFINTEEMALIQAIRHDSRFAKFADCGLINVGITTGNNTYFSITEDTCKRYALESVSLPLIGRSSHANSIFFTTADWKTNVVANKRARLVSFPDLPIEDYRAEHKEYISLGELSGQNDGYKCSIRDRWYIVPSVWVPDAFFLRRSNLYPKFILNRCGAVSTDTMHRIKFTNNINPENILLSYYNSISFAFTEICGRSYGGGVLEILPGELGNVMLPKVTHVDKDICTNLLNRIDKIVRKGNDIETALDIVDREVLIEILGIDAEWCEQCRRIWKKLQKRRLSRGTYEEVK